TPTLDQFDLLNNKWLFWRLGKSCGLPVPDTRLFGTRQELLHSLISGDMGDRIVVKPLTMDAGRGVNIVQRAKAHEQVESIDYSPLLAQEFVDGQDMIATAYCEHGRVVSYVCSHQEGGTYTAFASPGIRDEVTRIVAQFGCSGVYNFDLR